MELDQARIDRLRRLSSVAGGGAVLIGAMAMLGWILGVDALKSVVPGLVTMKANTALAFILLGTALHIGARDDGRYRVVGRVATVAVLALAATVFSQFVHGRDLGVDLFLFDEPKGTAGTVHPGRMALNTSLCFILASVAVLALDMRGRWAALAPMLGLFVGAAALFALVGYLAGLTNLYGIPTQTQMAVPTAVGMLLLGGGLTASRADRGPMRLCASDGAGGTLVRHILPAAVVGILVLTVLRLVGQNAGLYGTTIGVWLLASSYIVLLVTIVWRAGWSMEHTDSQRRAMANELKRLSERDPLTGLFNRRRLHEELVRQIAVLERHGRGFAVLMLDLDGFKQVNDTSGHAAGDALLVEVAHALKRRVRTADYVARFGGDEFVILLTEVGEGAAEAVAEKLLDAVRGIRIPMGNKTLTVCASVGGLTCMPDPDRTWTPEAVMSAADAELYVAKCAGRDGASHHVAVGRPG